MARRVDTTKRWFHFGLALLPLPAIMKQFVVAFPIIPPPRRPRRHSIARTDRVALSDHATRWSCVLKHARGVEERPWERAFGICVWW
jgi:hypothetical protein